MKKRVSIARAICADPEIILYDEPTTGVDPITADAINQLIKSLHDKLQVTSIVVTHDMIVPYDVPFEHVHPNDIETPAKIILCSHYHKPFTYKKGKQVFVNPGSLTRLDPTDMDRQPEVLLLTCGKDIKIKHILLKSAKKSEDVFDISVIKEKRRKVKDFESFINALKKTTYQSLDIKSEIKKKGKELTLPDVIINEAVRRYEEEEHEP